MALQAFYITGNKPSGADLATLAITDSANMIELPNTRAFKLVADATDGFVIYLNTSFWSVKHTGLANDGTTPATGTQFYAHGLVVPTIGYTATTDITRASIPLVSGQDEVVGVNHEENNSAIFFKSGSGAPVLLFRRNEADLSHGAK